MVPPGQMGRQSLAAATQAAEVHEVSHPGEFGRRAGVESTGAVGLRAIVGVAHGVNEVVDSVDLL